MKKIYALTISLLLLINLANAQVPQGFKYQTAIRDNNGAVIANKLVAIKLSLLTGAANGTAIYSEVHKVASNDFGVANLNVGNGTVGLGNFSTIDWGSNTFFLKTEVDINNGTSFIFMGSSQLLSVPFAMYAAKSANASDDKDKDSTNELQSISLTNNNLQLNKNGGSVDLTKYDKDSQQLVLNGNILSITKGNSVVLSGAVDLDADPSNELQNLSISKDTLKLSKANYIVLPKDNDADSSNEIQSLTYRNDSLYLSKSNFIKFTKDNDRDSLNELQTISRSNDTLYLSKSNFTVLPKVNAVPSGSIITLENYDSTLINNGYSYWGRMPYELQKKVSDSASWQWQESVNNSLLPDGSMSHTAVWTGTDMIVIGQPSNPFYMKYNLISNLWSNISSSPTPVGTYARAVWTGTEVLLLNIPNDTSKIYKYNPNTNLWSTVNTINTLGVRLLYSAIWTGTEMIIWGGRNNILYQNLNTGQKYNPTTNTWTSISTLNCPSARFGHSAVWTGSEMLIYGGTSNDSTLYRYNPSTNNWSNPITNNSNIALDNGLSQHVAFWSGADMIIFGGVSNGNIFFNKTLRYNLTSNTWFETPINNLTLTPRYGHSVVWTGTEAIIWGGYDGRKLLNDGRRLKFLSPTFQGNLTNSFLHLFKKN
jgi:hypothetical protein